jgi:cytochrome c biogenesis protein
MTARPTAAAPPRPQPASGPLTAPARLARATHGLLTSVRFAAAQITAIAVAGVAGIIVPQLPGVAFRSPADYTEQMAILRERVEPSLGPGIVAAFEALGLFRVFSAPWFTALLALLAVSIVICTLDRTPGLWRSARDVRVVQPDAFFDPALPGRAVIAGGLAADDVHRALERARFNVREVIDGAGAIHFHGDRHQYARLFTLLTHAGLIGFILAALVTSRFGMESGLVLLEDQAVPVSAIGTPDLVSVKNLGFRAPRDADDRFVDFTTDLAVYRGGELIARKVIRVNDPLEAAGYSFHQNFFGPAVDLAIRDGSGKLLWAGPIPLEEVNAGRPYARFAIPGRDEGVEMLLGPDAAGAPSLTVVGFRIVGEGPDGAPVIETTFVGETSPGGTYTVEASDLRVTFESVTAYAGVIVKRDPGATLVWVSFGLLILGLALTFFLPRRRVWARLSPEGELRIVGRADREVDIRPELTRLIEDLVGRRRSR